jgi:hypothetical protein
MLIQTPFGMTGRYFVLIADNMKIQNLSHEDMFYYHSSTLAAL